MATATVAPARSGLNPELSAGMSLMLTKTIRAPRAKVFAAWTDPAILTQWMGPEEFSCEAAEVDLRIGGRYRIVMVMNDGSRRSEASGEYTEIVPGERVQFTWRGCWKPEEVSLVTVMLRDSATAGATEVTLRHERIMSDDSARGFEKGWTGSLNKLAAHFGE